MRVDISQDLEHFDAARGLECAAVRVTALGDERQLDQVEQRLTDEPAAYRAERIDLADGRDEAAVQDPIRPGERAVRSQQMLVPARMAVAAQAFCRQHERALFRVAALRETMGLRFVVSAPLSGVQKDRVAALLQQALSFFLEDELDALARPRR